MTSRERVLETINHKEPDRVPLDFYGFGSSENANNILHHYGCQNGEEVLKIWGIDLKVADPDYIGPELKKFPDGSWEDMMGVIYTPIKHGNSIHNQIIRYVLQEANTVDDLRKHRWPKADWYNYSTFADHCKQWTGYAVKHYGPNSIFQEASLLRPMEQVLIDMMINPEMAHYIYDRLHEFNIEYISRLLNAGQGLVDIVRIGDDFGTQNGLLMSRQMFRDWFFKSMKEFCDVAHQKKAKVMLHCCGSCYDIIPDIIEAGVDVLNPVQVSAAKMDPVILKNKFGKDICFHGAIDEQHILSSGTSERVKEETKKIINELASGGGYILAPTHFLSADTPWKNIVAMYEAAKEFGQY